MEGKVEVNVDKAIVRPIIEAEIHTVIAAALGNKAELLQAAVARALNMKVDGDGSAPRYPSDRDTSYIEWLSKQAIHECAKAAVQSWVEQNKAKIITEVEAQLKRKTKGLSKIMVDGFAEAIKNDYRLNINFNVEPRKYA